MIKKVCKKEINVLFVLYLIVLKYLIKNRESTFTFYLFWLITSFSTQKEIKSQVRSKKTPDNVKKDFGICGKEPINKSKTANLRSGNYYYNARWYDPNLGRFITEDPIRAGNNWFIYANNSPLRFIDPTGLDSADAAYSREESRRQYAYENHAEYQQKSSTDYVIINAFHSIRKQMEQITVPKPPALVDPIEDYDYSSSFGARDPITFKNKKGQYVTTSQFHKGTDTAAPEGTPQRAMADGEIKSKGNNDMVGNYLFVDHENGYRTGYYHLKEVPDLNVGDLVTQEETVGLTGDTGELSTNSHGHNEFRWNGDVYRLDLEEFTTDE